MSDLTSMNALVCADCGKTMGEHFDMKGRAGLGAWCFNDGTVRHFRPADPTLREAYREARVSEAYKQAARDPAFCEDNGITPSIPDDALTPPAVSPEAAPPRATTPEPTINLPPTDSSLIVAPSRESGALLDEYATVIARLAPTRNGHFLWQHRDVLAAREALEAHIGVLSASVEEAERGAAMTKDGLVALSNIVAAWAATPTGCCKRCGTPPRIESGPVNDIICTSVDPRCECNAGFNLWMAERPAARRSVPLRCTCSTGLRVPGDMHFASCPVRRAFEYAEAARDPAFCEDNGIAPPTDEPFTAFPDPGDRDVSETTSEQQEHEGETENGQPQGQVPSRDASRELDALIAEKVMGWTDVCSTSRKLYGGSEWYVPHGRPSAAFLKYEKIPEYSTDIAAAWLVVEKVIGDLVQWQLDSLGFTGEEWRCLFVRGDEREMLIGEAPTAPLAICRAALAAVEAV